jgi:hypothetical protein
MAVANRARRLIAVLLLGLIFLCKWHFIKFHFPVPNLLAGLEVRKRHH